MLSQSKGFLKFEIDSDGVIKTEILMENVDYNGIEIAAIWRKKTV